LEVADVFRQYGPSFRQEYGATLSPEQRRAMRAIERCRTAALGGHVDECDACGHRVISYNSCRNRHCPKCQGGERAAWLEERQAELLPVAYFHVVFTIPEEVAAVALQNKRCVYDLLFQAAARTLVRIAADPRHLGAEIGFLAVLHTWGQNLMHHPHVHCVVPGGGLSPDGGQWVSCRAGFFLPVRVLSRLFRRLFLTALEDAFRRGELSFHGKLQELAAPGRFAEVVKRVGAREWVVYAKPPFGGPSQVLSYLGRYTHRVALSNERLVGLKEGQVSFRWKDYRHGNQQQVMTLAASEFIRRFLLHVLPRGFQRLRHYGFLSNRQRAEKLERCRRLLGAGSVRDEALAPAATAPEADVGGEGLAPCPECHGGRMRRVEVLTATAVVAGSRRPRVPRWEKIDSS
jgi:hypothetical protein